MVAVELPESWRNSQAYCRSRIQALLSSESVGFPMIHAWWTVTNVSNNARYPVQHENRGYGQVDIPESWRHSQISCRRGIWELLNPESGGFRTIQARSTVRKM